MDRDEILGQLREKLDRNLAEIYDEWYNLDYDPLIERADEIIATRTVYNELLNGYAFSDDELSYLLRFDNPLKVVRDIWSEHH